MNPDSEHITTPPDGRPHEEQPRWRQDFPIDWPQDEYISRREFVKFLLLTSAAFTTGQFWFILQHAWQMQNPIREIKAIAHVDELPVGESTLFKYPGEHGPNRLLVRVDEQNFVAYEQQCTHLTCPVLPDVPHQELHCPCHEGIFDLLTGRPLAGPPRRPLARVTLEIKDGIIYATSLEKRTV